MSITTFLAIWGCVLSTVLAIIEIKKFFKDKASVKVTINGSYMVIPKTREYGDKLLILIDVVNKGRRSISICQVGMLMPRHVSEGIYSVFNESIKTVKLTEGENVNYRTFENEAKEKGITSDKYIAYALDTTGKKHWSHNWLVRLYKLNRIK